VSPARRVRALVALLLLVACDKPAATGEPAARVVAVAPAAENARGELCDPRPAGSAPLRLTLPALAGDAAMDVTGPAWINVWATWCPPCVEELPLVRKLAAELARATPSVRLALVSVDDSDDAVRAFAEKHPEVRGSLRVRDLGALDAWLPSVGLDRSATLPLHLFVDAKGELVCTRTGAIGPDDLPRIEELLVSGRR